MVTGLLIIFPLLVALLLAVFRPAGAKKLAFAAGIIELAVSLYAACTFDKNGGIQFFFSTPWIASLGINFSVGMDGISLLLVLLTTVLVPFIILSSTEDNYSKPSSFYALVLMMQAALVGVFTASDGFLFYVFWELALIPIYFICLLWGGENRAPITLKFFIYTLAGSLLMLVALVYLFFQTPGTHTFDINALYAAGRALPDVLQSMIFWALFIAFAIKMPVFPFHTWQPDTYTTAPAQGTMLLSGIMLKMGIYGLIRWLIPVVPVGVAEWGTTAVILSVIGIVYASCIALVQKDIKRLIAYSSIAHVGLIAAGVMTLSPIGMQGAVIQMLSHGIVVVGLFYLVEIISVRTKTLTISELGGIRNVAPVFSTVFVIIMLGSVALPLTSGFVGEFLLINSLVKYRLLFGAIAGVTMILGAVYMLRAFQRTVSGEVSERVKAFTDLTTTEKLVLYPIVILIVVIGIYPAPLLAISEPAVDGVLKIISDATASIR